MHPTKLRLMSRSKSLMGSLIVKSLVISSLFVGFQASATVMNFNGDYSGINGTITEDPTKPVVSGRSYFTTEVEPIDDKSAKLIVHLWHGEKMANVSLSLQVAINSGVQGAANPVNAIHIDLISNQVKDNPDLFYSRREFILNYDDLTQKMRANLPAAAQHLTIGPGTPLFLYGKWHTYAHNWGSLSRGGLFYLPESKVNVGQTQVQQVGLDRQVTDLDVAYKITNIMALKYNTMDKGKSRGLKVNGQVRSRLEMEGKYQVPLEQSDEVLKKLFALSEDKNLAANVFGPDWSIEAEMRYMKRDSKNELLRDAKGNPVPDPMVDTYYDSSDSKGATKDLAFRYRWTEGNATGSWNFKPGMTEVRENGVVHRLEFAVDTTDDKPETIKKFVDSNDLLNPFREIRNQFVGVTPSEFLNPALRINDTRYKFKLKHKSGLVVEVSLDNVDAESLRNGRKAKFVQLEMDVDHPATSSLNQAKPFDAFFGLSLGLTQDMKDFLAKTGGDSFLDGRPVIHKLTDVESKSPIQQKFLPDFSLAEDMIVKLRDHTLGENWMMAPQKASLAAYLLKHVTPKASSPSVRRLSAQARSKKMTLSKLFQAEQGAKMCRRVYKK